MNFCFVCYRRASFDQLVSCSRCNKSRHLKTQQIFEQCKKVKLLYYRTQLNGFQSAELDQPTYLFDIEGPPADLRNWTCEYCRRFDLLFEEEPQMTPETRYFILVLLGDTVREWVSYCKLD